MKFTLCVRDLRNILPDLVVDREAESVEEALEIGQAIASRSIPGDHYRISFPGVTYYKKARSPEHAVEIASFIAKNSERDEKAEVEKASPFGVEANINICHAPVLEAYKALESGLLLRNRIKITKHEDEYLVKDLLSGIDRRAKTQRGAIHLACHLLHD